jgi:beta-galactosidase
VLATYGASNGWLDGQPAITRHYFGKGTVTFIGAYLDDVSQKSLLQQITREAAITPVMVTPAGVEACRRVTVDNREIFILINYNRSEQRVQLPWSAQDHLKNNAVGNQVTLSPYDVAVLTRKE